jgi:hypothetical protein
MVNPKAPPIVGPLLSFVPAMVGRYWFVIFLYSAASSSTTGGSYRSFSSQMAKLSIANNAS